MLHGLKGEGNDSFKIKCDAVLVFKVFAKCEENIQIYTKAKARLKPKLISQNQMVLTEVFKSKKKRKRKWSHFLE